MNLANRIFFVAIVVGILISVFGVWLYQPSSPSKHSLGFTTNPGAYLGTRGTATVGWSIPADTLIATSYTASQQLTGFINAGVEVYPYQVSSGTVIVLGLYINGVLGASSRNVLTGNYSHPANIVGVVNGDWANFSNSGLGVTVWLSSLAKPLPVGTVITLTVWVSHPVWIQFDDSPTTNSYEIVNLMVDTALSTIQPTLGDIAPHTVTWGVWSDTA